MVYDLNDSISLRLTVSILLMQTFTHALKSMSRIGLFYFFRKFTETSFFF